MVHFLYLRIIEIEVLLSVCSNLLNLKVLLISKKREQDFPKKRSKSLLKHLELMKSIENIQHTFLCKFRTSIVEINKEQEY